MHTAEANGTLAARVAVGDDVLQNLHQQLGQVLQGLCGQARRRNEKIR